MPPSPSLRRSRSPARETYHKRTNSFGNVLPVKSKDDELALFSDMQKIETENFLLEPSEDFDDSIGNASKLSYFPEVKLGVNIPAHGESHDLLNADGDKNDYEWLLTPPETPLFRSLDDEENQSITQVSRGRAQSKPIQISRSSMMDNSQRASRSSASPSRLSPSPRSMGRTRSSSSASRSSPPLAVQSQTPSRRSSTPPIAKTLTPPQRSPSPVSRRMSTGSSGLTLNGTRGASPVKPNRRSSSPKLHGWQSNVPGFPFDAPSNLRTSLTDRPVCRSRGGSPSSFSGLENGSRGRRQSMSPTPSRRANSSHSIERDRMSSYSKASATSSGEDDLDSMQSVPISYSSSPVVKKSLVVMKTRTIASSKNLSKNFTPSSVPKRSFDSALWLMDHRKAPQDRFRPLLSGAPASTFGAGNGIDVHKPMFSHNSSLTTSRNASSYHGATFGSYTPGSQEQRDLVGEWEEDDSSRGHEDIFMFDKLDELNEEDIHYKSTESTDNSLVIVKHLVSGRQDLEGSRRPNQSLCHSTDSSQVGNSKIATCSRCGKLFDAMDVDEEGVYCDVCASKVGNIFTGSTVQTIGEENQQYDKTAKLKPCIASDPPIPTDCIGYSKEVSLDHQLVNSESYTDCLDQAPPIHSMGHTPQEMLLGQVEKIDAEHRKKHVGDSLGNTNDISFHRSSVTECEETKPTYLFIRDQMDNHNHGLSQCNETVSETMTSDNSPQLGSTTYQNPKLETTEGTGISVLLVPKSNSNKWPVVEGRALAATSILCSEPYYARDGVSMMKRSFGLDSSSAASSSDLGSSRQSTICFERLRSGKRGDFEKSQMSSTMSRQSIASVSDMSICSSSASLCPQSDAVGGSCFPIDTLESSTSRTLISSEENDAFCKDALPSAMEYSSSSQVIADDDSPVDLKSEVGDTTVENHSAGRMADMDHTSTNVYSLDTEMPSDTRESSGPEESCMPETEEDTYAISQCNKGSAPEHSSDENNFDDIQMQSEIVQGSAEENRLDDCYMSAISEEDVLISGQEADIRKLPNDEEFCAEVEGSRKQIQRCFTLEEAADTILFCSSIVHDLAYKAATIALENRKESEFVDSIRPTVTIVGGSFPKEESLPKLPHRRTPNRKVKRKRLEGETTTTETTEKDAVVKDSPPVCSASGIARNSDNMKPPKLESKCNCIIM
ncbi:probable GPI-anchored adhesin-like protein PGA55 isoform X1 [Miscanthus floridulus]|uniref:probable GPI-anchored adhesin-like protein PGA55 isoform X1 n=2 Tax=Miscanthus floridulus TaxID=154761 RepID=UPI00345A0471